MGKGLLAIHKALLTVRFLITAVGNYFETSVTICLLTRKLIAEKLKSEVEKYGSVQWRSWSHKYS
jgi:hypothetical protein